jgi:hypothetical protein
MSFQHLSHHASSTDVGYSIPMELEQMQEASSGIDFKLRTLKSKFEIDLDQGCQMVDFENKIPNLGKFWSVLQ